MCMHVQWCVCAMGYMCSTVCFALLTHFSYCFYYLCNIEKLVHTAAEKKVQQCAYACTHTHTHTTKMWACHDSSCWPVLTYSCDVDYIESKILFFSSLQDDTEELIAQKSKKR